MAYRLYMMNEIHYTQQSKKEALSAANFRFREQLRSQDFYLGGPYLSISIQ